ncbi:MAG: hypothetical protein IJX63_00930, partial [Lachnospiraceae bacterium]|nr:hypothetical protein [Lachnospiraceae bacterium]
MRKIAIFLLGIFLFTGCGTANQTSNHSVPPVTTSQVTSQEVLQNVSAPPVPTLVPGEGTNIEETVVSTDVPTEVPMEESIIETPQPIPEDLYPPDRVLVEASEEDRNSWTSTVHFTEPQDKYISLTYDNERLCFDRTVDEIYGPDVITYYGNFYNNGANFELACSHAIKSRWQVAQEDSAWKYVASCPRESGSIEIYTWNDYGYYIFYEYGPYSLAQIRSHYEITEDNLKRSNFEDIFDFVSCIGEITVTEGKYDYELPYLQTYEVVDVTPYDMYVNRRAVNGYDRPDGKFQYYIADLYRNDKVTVTGYCISPNNEMVRIVFEG